MASSAKNDNSSRSSHLGVALWLPMISTDENCVMNLKPMKIHGIIDLVFTDGAGMTEMFGKNSCNIGKWAQFQLEEIYFHLAVFHKETLLDNMSLQGIL